MRRFVSPLVLTVVLAIIAWWLRSIPLEQSIFIRVFNGFLITALLIWIIQRGLHYERMLEDFFKVILELVHKGQEDRRKDLDNLSRQTAEIAAELAKDAAAKAAELARVQADQAGKIESIKTTGEDTNETIKKLL